MLYHIDKPPRVQPRLKSAPKIRQLYWCDFPKDAQLPEFWKRRPIIVISPRNTLFGTVTVIPLSTLEQSNNKWAVQVHAGFDIDVSWAICDKITTVAVSRLSTDRDGVKRLSEEEFQTVLQRLLTWLPKVNMT